MRACKATRTRTLRVHCACPVVMPIARCSTAARRNRFTLNRVPQLDVGGRAGRSRLNCGIQVKHEGVKSPAETVADGLRGFSCAPATNGVQPLAVILACNQYKSVMYRH